MQTPAVPSAANEVVDLCRDLIRIDTTNFGDDSGPGERKAAEYVAGVLDEVGIGARLHESATGRTSLSTKSRTVETIARSSGLSSTFHLLRLG